MLVYFVFGAFIKAVLSSPLILPKPFDSTSLIVIGHDISQQCADAANNRTLYEILRSCAATTFACTWVSMHKNVPDTRKSKFRLLIERIILFNYAVCAPDCVCLWAYRQRLAASRHVEQYNDTFFESTVEQESWSQWFRNLFSFQRFRNWFSRQWFPGWFSPQDDHSPRPWTLTHGFLLEMGGLVIIRDGEPPELVKSVKQLPHAINIPLGHIMDKSKRDALAKLLVIFQTAYFAVQCVARWAARLDVTEIETLTFAFVLSNVLTYAFWWDKPQDMNYPIEIHLPCPAFRIPPGTKERPDISPNQTSETESKKLESTHTSPNPVSSKRPWWMTIFMLPVTALLLFRDYFIYPFCVMFESKTGYEEFAIAKLFYTSAEGISEATMSVMEWISLILSAIVFGGVHLIPVWLSDFPTAAERWAWFGASVWITAYPIIILTPKAVSPLISKISPHSVGNHPARKYESASSRYLLCLGIILGGFARICILLLALLTLRQLSCKAFEIVNWSNFIPHI